MPRRDGGWGGDIPNTAGLNWKGGPGIWLTRLTFKFRDDHFKTCLIQGI